MGFAAVQIQGSAPVSFPSCQALKQGEDISWSTGKFKQTTQAAV